MPKTHIRHIRVSEYFPPEDPYATTVARLCILREDFLTEAEGAAAQSLLELDRISPQFRRLYFLRNSIRTVHEIRTAVHKLCSNEDFKRILSEQPTQVQDDFEKSYKKLVAQAKYVKDLRNKIAGGHVLQESVQEGLNRLDPSARELIQVGEVTRDTRFKFAHYLVLQAMFPGHQGREPEQVLDEFLEKIKGPIHEAMMITELVFKIYVRGRGLH